MAPRWALGCLPVFHAMPYLQQHVGHLMGQYLLRQVNPAMLPGSPVALSSACLTLVLCAEGCMAGAGLPVKLPVPNTEGQQQRWHTGLLAANGPPARGDALPSNASITAEPDPWKGLMVTWDADAPAGMPMRLSPWEVKQLTGQNMLPTSWHALSVFMSMVGQVIVKIHAYGIDMSLC